MFATLGKIGMGTGAVLATVGKTGAGGGVILAEVSTSGVSTGRGRRPIVAKWWSTATTVIAVMVSTSRSIGGGALA